MADNTKSVIIGLFVLAAFSIIIFMMLFLHPNIGNEGKILHVRFADIDKVTIGTRVTYGGKPVGEVIDIKEIENHRNTGGANPESENGIPEEGWYEYNGIIYVYELTLAVDSSVDLYTSDDITARTSGLLGEKSVAIMPVAPKKGEVLIPITDQVLFATETGSIETTLKEFKELSSKVEVTLDGFIEAFDKMHNEKFWENLGAIAQNFTDISAAINKPGPLSNIVDDLSSTLSSAKQIFSDIQNGRGTIGKLIYNDDIHSDLSFITNNIRNGEGSLGKILVKDDFYLRLASLMSKAEVTLNDVNHYGLLFHLDKGWKRLRARRMNMMEKLCSPQEFRNYFNDEIDSITTSIERVSLVLQKSDEVCPCGYLFQNPEYVKVYAELLRRVTTLEEYLEMYNQQVMDCDVRSVEFLE